MEFVDSGRLDLLCLNQLGSLKRVSSSSCLFPQFLNRGKIISHKITVTNRLDDA